jgi:hypothetical protein
MVGFYLAAGDLIDGGYELAYRNFVRLSIHVAGFSAAALMTLVVLLWFYDLVVTALPVYTNVMKTWASGCLQVLYLVYD